MRYNIIENKTKKELDELYEDNSLTFEGTQIEESNLDFLVKWLKEHDCIMRTNDFYIVKGHTMNEIYNLTDDNCYPDTCNILCVKLSDLSNISSICLARFELQGRWFNDIVDNNSRREEAKR